MFFDRYNRLNTTSFFAITYSLCFFLSINANAVEAPEPPACSISYSGLNQFKDNASNWWKQSKFLITRTNQLASNRRSYYFSGDTIRINESNFPHLAASPETAITKIDTIVIDGRNVIIDMPINLASGRIEIRAEQISFTPNGSFGFYSAPAQSNEGVFLLARRIDVSAFAVKNYLPFNFATTGHTWEAGRIRRISVRAGEFIGPLAGLDAQAGRERLYFSTLDPESALIASGEADIAKRFTFEGGASATEAYLSAIQEGRVRWPTRLAEAVRDFQFQYSNDQNAKSYAEQIIEQHRESLGKALDASVSTTISAALGRYNRNEDGLGLSPFYVPRENVESLRSETATRIENLLTLGKSWLDVYMDASRGRRLDRKYLDGENKRIADEEKEIASISADIDNLLSQSATISQEIAASDARLKDKSERIKSQIEEGLKKQSEANQIRAAGTALSYAAALLPGGPAVQVGVSTIALAGSRAVAGNQIGDGSIKDAAALFSMLADDTKAAENNLKAARSLQCDWRKATFLLKFALNKSSVSSDLDASERCAEGVKRPEGNGLRAAGEALSALAARGENIKKSFLDQLNAASPNDPNFAKLAAEDDEFQKLTRERSALSEQMTRVVDRSQKAQQDIIRAGQEIVANKARISDALASDLELDAGNPNLRAIALGAARENLQMIVVRMNLLLRAVSYHTGQNSIGSSGVNLASLQSSINSILDQATSSGSVNFSTAEAPDFDSIAASVSLSLNSARLQIGQMLSDIDIGYDAFLSRTGHTQQFSIAMPYVRPKQETEGNIKSAVFLDSINRSLAGQVTGGDFATLIAIPAQRWDGAFGKRERLIGVKVDLSFSDPKSLDGRSIELRVLHPRFGKIHTLAGCQFYDFRSVQDTDLYDIFTTTCSSESQCTASTMTNLPEMLNRENQKRIFLPVDTTYLLQIVLHGGSATATIPSVEKATVTTSVLR